MNFLLSQLRGVGAFLMYLFNTLFWAPLLFAAAIVKLIIPVSGWRRFCDRILNGIATGWIGVNNVNQRIFSRTRMKTQGLENLEKDQWYMVVANHQSWVDILVLQNVFNRKIPFLKFFLKKELIWVPIMGLCWWALEFPFMKRYSRKFLEKKPHLKGKDLEITRKACEKFKRVPVTVMNFVEGTRFTREKHRSQKSPFNNLLKPKSGGIAFVLGAMGEQLHTILDVTIVYPHGIKSFWDFLCGKVQEVRVSVKSMAIQKDMLGDYFRDTHFRGQFQDWLNRQWREKDRQIDEILCRRLAEPS